MKIINIKPVEDEANTWLLKALELMEEIDSQNQRSGMGKTKSIPVKKGMLTLMASCVSLWRSGSSFLKSCMVMTQVVRTGSAYGRCGLSWAAADCHSMIFSSALRVFI